MAAVPSIGRATRVERPVAPGADAAGALYERYSAQILSYCMHQLGSREEAEDAVQTTFMNAFRGLQRGIVPELESAWLFKIAHNVCLSRRRSSWRRGKVEAPNNFEVLQEIVPGRDQVADELIRLQDVLERMPENQRRAILLREWQGLTYREISDELGLSQAAVETLIFRARRALAQGLEQDDDTWKKRLRRGADFGGAIAFIQALLGGGGAAVKVAATAIAVGSTALVGATDSAPRQTYRSVAAQPAMTAKATPQQFAPTSTSATTFARTAKKSAAVRARPTERQLPQPVAVPATSISEATQTAPTQTSPTPLPPATESTPAVAPATATTESPAAPADEKGSGKEKSERAPQSTHPPPESEPVPANEPLPQPEPTPGHEQKQDTSAKSDKPEKPDKPDHSDNGKGNGNGNK